MRLSAGGVGLGGRAGQEVAVHDGPEVRGVWPGSGAENLGGGQGAQGGEGRGPQAPANAAPRRSASASGAMGRVPISEPLSPMAPAKRSLDQGEAIWALTE